MDYRNPEGVVVAAAALLVEDVLGVVHGEAPGVQGKVRNPPVVGWKVWNGKN